MEAKKELKIIENIVKQYLFPTQYDTEDIAVKIWIELYEKKKYLSRLYVKNRCIDEIRRKRRISFCPIEAFLNLTVKQDENEDAKELIELLMEKTVLTIKERYLIYLAFYKDEKVSLFLLHKVLDKLKKELTLLLKAKGDYYGRF